MQPKVPRRRSSVARVAPYVVGAKASASLDILEFLQMCNVSVVDIAVPVCGVDQIVLDSDRTAVVLAGTSGKGECAA